MSNQTKTIKEYVVAAFEQAQAAIKNKSSVYVWGGQFSSAEHTLGTFLDTWNTENGPQFQFSMVEHVNYFRAFLANLAELGQQANLLERIRLFGPAGDLDIRRDGETIYWRFISETDTALPDLAPFGMEAYPEKGKTFAKDERSYLLWRSDKQEQRVKHAWAEGLDFTHLQQVQYLENGRVAFVRYIGFVTEGQNE